MRLFFKDLNVGDTILKMPVVFTEVTARKTKAGKPYLNVKMFDGLDKVEGNYWDWAGNAKPAVNTQVYGVSGEVSAYQGNKQINIKGISADPGTSLTDFQPSSGKQVDAVYADAVAFITDNVFDDLLRDLTLGALSMFKEAWLVAPGAVGVHHAYVAGTLIHSLSVAKIAKSLADNIPEAHKDLCIVGGMLHDLGKLDAYAFDGATPVMTDRGKLFEHACIGIEMLKMVAYDSITLKTEDDAVKMDIISHIILSHHGELEHGAVVNPQCLEAHLVHLADKADATAEMIIDASNKSEGFWTDKVWALNNRPVINYRSIKELQATTYSDELPFGPCDNL